jgi:hypothetical protein
VSITTSDVTTYDPPLEAIMVTVTGAVALVFTDGTAATVPLNQGIVHNIGGIYKVMATGTAATGIYGFRG